jgi:hypothetical protein
MESGALDATEFVQKVQRQDDARETGASAAAAEHRGTLYSQALSEENGLLAQIKQPKAGERPVVRGRPTRYTVQLASAICWELTQGKSLLEICRHESMPHRDTVHNWLNIRPEFPDMYARAREIQAHVLADEALAIADDTSSDRTEDGNPNWEAVQRARLRVDTRKWLASKLLPSTYADKTLHTGPDGQSPIQVQHTYRLDQLTPTELAELQRLLHKARAPLIEG